MEDYFTTCGRTGTPLTDCLVIDAHGHLTITPGFVWVDSSPEGLVAAMDRMGIDRIHVSASWGNSGLARHGNDVVLDAVQRFPERIHGYITMDIGYPETILPELERCYAAGLRAVKIWSYSGRRSGLPYNHPTYDLVYGFAEERGLPLLAHTWGYELDELEPAFQKYRRIRWILAHTGSQAWDKYVRAAHTYPHVYLETCLSRCPRGLFERLVEEVPLHKILWGSDEVFISASQQLGRVLFARITPEQKRAILGENAARVLAGA